MTWTKTGTEFPDDCANVGLSDAAYRTHHEAITWLYMVERMDMLVPKRLAGRVMFSASAESAITDLVDHGFWSDLGDAWQVNHHADVVRRSIVAQRKKLDRDKRNQAAARERKSGQYVSADVSADADRQTDKQAATTGATPNGAEPWPDFVQSEPLS